MGKKKRLSYSLAGCRIRFGVSDGIYAKMLVRQKDFYGQADYVRTLIMNDLNIDIHGNEKKEARG